MIKYEHMIHFILHLVTKINIYIHKWTQARFGFGRISKVQYVQILGAT